MIPDIVVSPDGSTITVTIPFKIRKRGGRKLIVAPDGCSDFMPSRQRADNTLVKAIARAFRWRKMMESGHMAAVDEIAAAEKINASYVSRILRLTLLAPDIVDMILDGRQPAQLQLARLLGPFPVEWSGQRETLLVTDEA